MWRYGPAWSVATPVLTETDNVMTEAACSTCGFKLWLPVVRLRTSYLGLYDDARFPGRCLLVLTEHVEDLTALPQEVACDFLEDARDSARAIQSVTGSPRINYAILGNTESHLHWHLIPRRPDAEERPARPVWEDPRPVTPLDADEATRVVEQLRSTLA